MEKKSLIRLKITSLALMILLFLNIFIDPIWALGQNNEEALIYSLKNDRNAEVREKAAYSLGGFKSEEALDALIYSLKKDTVVDVRIGAAYSLGGFKSEEALDALIYSLKNDNSTRVKSSVIASIRNFKSEEALDALIYALRDRDATIRRTAVYSIWYMGFKSEKTLDALIYALRDNSPEVIDYAADIIADVICKKSDVAIITNKVDLAKKISNAINERILEEEKQKTAQVFAVAINNFHDCDNEEDVIRTEITKNLNFGAQYYLISLGGPDLYTSTFFKLYNEMIKDSNFLDKIQQIDPEQKYFADFILSLSNFNVLKNNIKKDPALFIEKMKLLLEDRPNIIRNTAMLYSTIDFILKDESLNVESSDFQDYILKRFKEYQEINFIEGETATGYLIKTEKDYFKENLNEIIAISQNLPEILEPRVPESWLADKKIVAKLYFYPDEISFENAGAYYGNKIGISQIEYKDQTTTLRLKPGNILKIKKENTNGIKINLEGNKVTIHWDESDLKQLDLEITEGGNYVNKGITFYNDGETIAIKRQLSDTEINIILTKNNRDVKEIIQDPKIDIMAHRGHSFHLTETFPLKEMDCHKKLLYIGSCGGFRSLPCMEENYNSCYYISDEDMGRGDDNNRILDWLTYLVASGEKNWNVIAQTIDKQVGASGIVYPTDKSMQIFDFLKKMKERESQPTQTPGRSCPLLNTGGWFQTIYQ